MALKMGEDSLTSPTSFGNDRNSFGYQVLCRTALDVTMWWFWLDFFNFPSFVGSFVLWDVASLLLPPKWLHFGGKGKGFTAGMQGGCVVPSPALHSCEMDPMGWTHPCPSPVPLSLSGSDLNPLEQPDHCLVRKTHPRVHGEASR